MTAAAPPTRMPLPEWVRSELHRRSGRAILVRLVLTIIVAVLVVFPVAQLVIGSFREGGPIRGGPFTLENYRQALSDAASGELLFNTLGFAIGQTIVPLIIGVVLAWVVTRTDVPWRSFWEYATISLYLIPLLAAATAWSILLANRTGIINVLIRKYTPFDGFDVFSLGGMIFVQSLYLVPLVFLVVSASFRSVNPEMEDASRVFGASPFRTFLRITLGVSRPSVMSAAVLCFIIGIGSMEVPLLFGFSSRVDVYTTDIYRALRVRFPPDYGRAAAIGVLLLMISLVVLWAYLRNIRHTQRYVTVGGRGARIAPIRLGLWRWVVFAGCAFFFTLTLVLPFAAVALGSLLPFIGRPSRALYSQASFDNYESLADNAVIWRAVKNSLTLAVGAGIVVMILGAFIAYIVVRNPSRWSRGLDYSAALPLTIPAVVLATALLFTYISLELPGGFRVFSTLWILGMGYVVYFLPIAVRQMTGPVIQLSSELEHASRIFGATQRATMVRIVLPLLVPALVGGGVLAFVTFLREFTTSVLLFDVGTEVVSTVMYSYYANGRMPYVAVMAVAMWGVVVVAMFIAQKLFKTKITF